MIRTVNLTPPPGDWIAYQIDEQSPDGWTTVAARPNPPTGAFSTAAAFTDAATVFRVVWVGEGGSKNMQIGDPQQIDDAGPAQAATYTGGAR